MLSDNIVKNTKFENKTGALGDYYYVGQNFGDIWGLKTQGVFQKKEEIGQVADRSEVGSEWKPGDIRYKDQNGDGESNYRNYDWGKRMKSENNLYQKS